MEQGVNSKPEFVEEPAKFLEVQKTESVTPWSYQLPFTADADGDEVTLTVDVPEQAAFIFYNSTLAKFSIDDLSSESVVAGTYQI